MKKTVLILGIIILLAGVTISSIAKLDKPLPFYNTHNNISYGSLVGYVTDTSGSPIQGALIKVYFHEEYEEDYSDEEGFYQVTNIPICYCMKNATCFKKGFKTEWVLLSIVENTPYDFILNANNHPPAAPDIKGKAAIKELGSYDYKLKVIDPDSDDVRFFIDWDDGNTEWTDYYSSGEEIIISHTWELIGDFAIKARASDTYGAIGPWGYLHISKPNNNDIKPNNPIESSENQIEIISFIEGICESITTTGLIINKPIEIYSEDLNLNISGLANLDSSVLPIYFQDKPIHVKTSCFYGVIFEVQPGILYYIRGIALGDTEWV
ncbi:hypothetical protein AYK24_06780 [Thermoplasmatales archaeon SG8-52-4]|nr:MAG: hypothetical protein AYK24_06780 [Thermoplasmatales archaeon SG8-52-4]